jgi:D-sedoheptulose 7-phosphate isomerase
MKVDPRHRNEIFDLTSVGAYLQSYSAALARSLDTVDRVALDQARHVVESTASNGKRIYAIGNGGSAAIADHLCCDWTKGTHVHGNDSLKAQSLSANVALYSAIANDYGFERVFSTQLEFLGQEGDLLVAISSSGNSANIAAAVEMAHGIGMSSIGLSGFEGGRLKEIAQVKLHVAACNYGIVEDAHQVLMHVLAQYIACHRD